jgi:hypothetical protein
MQSKLAINFDLQLQFAGLSGDFNPLHTDTEYSRRSQFGSPVVHGIHLLLTALERLSLDYPIKITAIKAEFRSAVLVGEMFDLYINRLNNAHRISIYVDNRICANFYLESEHLDCIKELEPQPYESLICKDDFEFSNEAELAGIDKGVVDGSLLSILFPNISRQINRSDIDFLLMITRTVGMKCPGKHALFRSFHWKTGKQEFGEKKTYLVKKFDKRFNILEIEFVSNNITSTVQVKIRPTNVIQPSSDEVQKFVASGEFVGIKALVIGGSRGLGELTARILACGDSKVLITYHKGQSDAEHLVAALGDAIDLLHFDSQNPSSTALRIMRDFQPTHLFYFATPPIQRQFSTKFNDQLYENFRSIYVTAFEDLIRGLGIKVSFFPSTTFIDTNQSGFSEYIQAKIDGESLCDELNRMGHSQVFHQRLPPLVTDQTSETLGTDPYTNIPVLLGLIRKIMETTNS